MSNYEQAADDFLAQTNTVLTAKFTAYKKHFADDIQSRDIFRITLKNNRHTFRFNFGQSINDSTGTGKNKPTSYDIISCLITTEVDSFDEFCSISGYDNDSRKAFKIYKDVKREWENIVKLFTPEEIKILQEIK
jgi:hypothetical protein